jgi:hypothetical protein
MQFPPASFSLLAAGSTPAFTHHTNIRLCAQDVQTCRPQEVVVVHGVPQDFTAFHKMARFGAGG